MKRDAAATEASDLLAPVIAWAQGNHGAVTKLADKMSELAGGEIHRQTLGRWLHKDPRQRSLPNLGHGLLLVKAYEELVGESE